MSSIVSKPNSRSWLLTMHKLNKLSKNAVKTAQPAQKPYTLADGGGLVLQVQPSGSRWWRLRYRYNGIPKMLSLGVYPDTDLDTAREHCEEARKLLAKGMYATKTSRLNSSTTISGSNPSSLSNRNQSPLAKSPDTCCSCSTRTG